MSDARALLRAVLGRAKRSDLTFLGAAIAYYAFVSLLPAVLLALAVASAVGGEAVTQAVLRTVDRFLTPAGESTVGDAIGRASGRGGATVVGVVGLAWSGLKVFRGLDRSFSRVYGTDAAGGLLGELRDAALVTGAIGAAGLAMLAGGVVLAVASVPMGGAVLGLLTLLVGLTLAFLPMYYVFPDVPVTLRESLPGAALAAVGWVLLQSAFQVYAAAAPQFALYGVIGGVLLLVTWFYAAAVLLLLGAALNAELAGRPARLTGTKTPAGGSPGDRNGRRPGR